MIDFSQSGEQAAILEWADRRVPGAWLDVGAADGEAASNTRALALEGWAGVAVEPAAWLFDALVGLYGDRPDVECVNALLSIEPPFPIERFHYSRDLVSTTDDDHADVWRDTIGGYLDCWVGQLSVVNLLRAFPGPYDFVNVDTEGTSVELWEELRRLDAFAPGALACVEAEDGGERWLIQRACTEGWARVLVTENNVLLERL